ncbi:unnamed protein product [Brassica napus]|uniref:(rape) hypothetical protein n=1 Tax=Brassica napus TaxID=3708 RepID=A0A816IH65_BRANA|nr:unnamed protein product [Brassica napus]
MRVLLCKIQCPSFICFSKPSPHIYTSGSQRLESTPPQVSFSTTTVVEANDDHYVDGLLNEVREEDCGTEEEEEEEEQGQCHGEILKSKTRRREGHSHGEILKSSLKKEVSDSADGGTMEKKKVQWVDLMGKELAEIHEFKSRLV